MKTIILFSGEECRVDDSDFEYLHKYKWAKSVSGYAVRYNPETKTQMKMHREIMGLKVGEKIEVDHINHNKLDNRRSNLRICTRCQNQRNYPNKNGNKSGYKGVFWSKRCKKWMVRLYDKRKPIYGGIFENIIDAAKKRDKMAKELYGKFANLNFKEN